MTLNALSFYLDTGLPSLKTCQLKGFDSFLLAVSLVDL